MTERSPGVDKRRIQRVQPFVLGCKVVDGSRRIPAYLTDLSPRGARVSTESPPPGQGASVFLEVRFRGQASRLRLTGRVKWVQPPRAEGRPHTFGLTFEGLGADQQGAIESVLGEFRRKAAALG